MRHLRQGLGSDTRQLLHGVRCEELSAGGGMRKKLIDACVWLWLAMDLAMLAFVGWLLWLEIA